jgi:hypothetical protein
MDLTKANAGMNKNNKLLFIDNIMVYPFEA